MWAIAKDWVLLRSLAFLVLVLGALQTAVVKAETLVPERVTIPAGIYFSGSDSAEREFAYRLDESAYGHSVTRKQGWYDSEAVRGPRKLPTYRITRNLITNQQYAQFIAATGQPAPDVDPEIWAGYRLIHPYSRTRRHAWLNNAPPEGREQHPVVLVSHNQAMAYARWLSNSTGQKWTLPTEAQWEKAARGQDGRRFPWGDEWRPKLLNSHDAGPFDTVAVGTYREGASPFGVLDMAGQVFEWTRTQSGQGRFIVKGGSWDDKGCGVCRAAARHTRPEGIKHILIGFRLVTE
jgi:formylglycine-generating enzyme required for sulfatase activity